MADFPLFPNSSPDVRAAMKKGPIRADMSRWLASYPLCVLNAPARNNYPQVCEENVITRPNERQTLHR